MSAGPLMSRCRVSVWLAWTLVAADHHHHLHLGDLLKITTRASLAPASHPSHTTRSPAPPACRRMPSPTCMHACYTHVPARMLTTPRIHRMPPPVLLPLRGYGHHTWRHRSALVGPPLSSRSVLSHIDGCRDYKGAFRRHLEDFPCAGHAHAGAVVAGCFVREFEVRHRLGALGDRRCRGATIAAAAPRPADLLDCRHILALEP